DDGTVKVDRANVEAASLNLNYCHIDAPASGITGPLLIDPGNTVTAGAATTLVTIAQIAPIYVSFSVPEDVLDQVRANQAKGPLEVGATTQAGQKIATGTLSLINNTVTTATGTVMLEATFPNTDEKLWPGEAVNVQLVLYMRKHVVTVPAATVMAGPTGPYVYVIEPGDTAKRAEVTVAATQNGLSVIGKGLTAGQRVVTNGQYRLANTVKVAIRSPPGSNGPTTGARMTDANGGDD
ncbi:MAG: efflux RND transporter periplasmic adaptor subunit, partial [Stellaceae bacterium]